jgi:hypothetical protein
LLHAALSPRPEDRPDAETVLDGLALYAQGGDVTEALPTSGTYGGPASPRRKETEVLPPVLATPNGYAGQAPPRAVSPLEGAGDEGDEWDEEEWEEPGAATEADPRIGRPRRTGALATAMAAQVALLAAAPLVGAMVAAAWAVAARAADRSVTSLVMRRHERGPRRSDVPVALATAPWHLAMAVVAAALGLLAPLAVMVAVSFLAGVVLGLAEGGAARPGDALPLALAAVLGVFTAWWGPASTPLRRGTRSLMRGVTPTARAQQIVVGVALVVVAGVVLWLARSSGGPTWWPSNTIPGPWRPISLGS